MNEKIYWIWLQQILGYGNRYLHTILEHFKSPLQLYEYYVNTYLTKKSIDKYDKIFKKFNSVNLSDCEKIVVNAEKDNQKIIPFNHPDYPQKLKNLINPPCVLYVKGVLPDFDNNLCVTIVGTRHATSYGMNMAFDFAYTLSKSEAIIISGGAVGIDITAHKATLRANGNGVCVLGCGIDYPYLEENKPIRQQISLNGALISEFPPGYMALGRNFPVRNRIMAALADAVLVVEAGKRSGSLITAHLALDQGKEVFAVPGNINSYYSRGTNEMIRDGAKVALEPDDILYDFSLEIKNNNVKINHYNKINVSNTKSVNSTNSQLDLSNQQDTQNNNITSDNFSQNLIPDLSELDDQTRKIYSFITTNPIMLEEIVDKTNIKVQNVLSSLTELEILGLIKSYPGKRFGLL